MRNFIKSIPFACIVCTQAAAFELPAGLDQTEVDLANSIVSAGLPQATSPYLEALLEERARQIVVALDDAKDISERRGNDLASIEFPLNIETPIQTLALSLPDTVQAFSIAEVDRMASIYSSAYETVLTSIQALSQEREAILDQMKDGKEDGDRLKTVEADLAHGLAASQVLNAQVRFLIETKGRIAFMNELKKQR